MNRIVLMLGRMMAVVLLGLAVLLLAATMTSLPVMATCDGLRCTGQSDCGSACFCNNPNGCQGCGSCFLNP